MTANTSTRDILVNPKLILLAFHLCQELTEEKTVDAESIWSRIAKISSHLKIPELQQLPQLIQQSQTTKVDRSEDNRNSDCSLFSLQGKIESLLSDPILNFAHPASENLPAIEGGIYPIKVYDTYVADLTISYKTDYFPIDLLPQVNPDGCLLPSQIQASLGQTLILFDRRLHPLEDYAAIATASVKAIVQSYSNTFLPDIIGKGKFLGGEIYQLEDDCLDPTERKHLLVWLASDGETIKMEEAADYYYPLLNLLCFRHKIQFIYYQARQAYTQARQLYREIELIINSFSQLKTQRNKRLETKLTQIRDKTRNRKYKRIITDLFVSSETELSEGIEKHLKDFHNKRLKKILTESQQETLKQLEEWLIQIPQISTNYDLCLRNLESHLTTIEINSLNYEKQLNRLQQIGLPTDDLSFLAAFLHNDYSQYQQQIKYDLQYLDAGKTLFDRTVETIRGLLRINLQKQKSIEELAEPAARRIELWVTVVGSGLTVSGLTSSIMAQPAQLLFQYFQLEYQQTWYGNQVSLLFWNLLLHSAIGIFAAILVAVIFRGAVENFLEFLDDRIRQR